MIPAGGDDGGRILDEPMSEALSRRYLAYALSTIMHRALPDVRDGMKPVHRRIMYAMGDMRLTPEAAAKRLRQAASDGLKTAILFGGERAGLDNDEISLCDALITIPTAPLPQVKDTELKAGSLNLGQAVLLLGYEWLKTADATPASRIRNTVGVPAARAELIDLFDHLERELDASGFFFPPARKTAMVRNTRAMIRQSGE